MRNGTKAEETKMATKKQKTMIATRNEEWGFWGAMLRSGDESAAPEMARAATQASWNTAIDALVNDENLTPEMARDFLDSRHGRHLADEVSNQMGNVRAALKRFAKQVEFFRKNHRAADFGEV